MDEDGRNTFGILMCAATCAGTGTGICDGMPSTCSSIVLFRTPDKGDLQMNVMFAKIDCPGQILRIYRLTWFSNV